LSSNAKNIKNKKNAKKKKKQRKSNFWNYFLIAFIVLSMGVVAAGSVLINKLNEKNAENNSNNNSIIQNSDNNIISNVFGEKRIKTNVAVFGTDKDGLRTDVIFVATFDSKTKKIGLVSVPRDTRVTITSKMAEYAKEKGKTINENFVCKINEVHAYAPKDYRNEFSVMQLEDLLNIKIDYYVNIDLVAFRNIVDAFGGVDIDVPQDMDYEDPYQDLYIHLKKGMQHLDGEKAEQLVRFRKYPQGDVARVEVQQLFLKEFAKKVLNTENIINNAGEILKNLYKYVKTDFGINDALKYVKYIKDINADNITMNTIPGEGKYIGNISYYIHDLAETRKLVDKVFYGLESEEEVTEPSETSSASKETVRASQDTTKASRETVKASQDTTKASQAADFTVAIKVDTCNSRDKNIEVLNGSYSNGKAAEFRDKLQKEGYTVTKIGTYTGSKNEYTLIIVSQNDMGEDLQKYFKSSKIEVSPDKLSDGADIRIIVGTSD